MSSELVTIEKKPAISAAFMLPPDMMASVQVKSQEQAVKVLAKVYSAAAAPRDKETWRQRCLEAAQVPSFAEKAISIKPIGKGLEVKSVRLAKFMAKEYGHLTWEAIDHGGTNASQVECRAWDYQKNTEGQATVTVRHEKWVNQAIKKVNDPDGIRMLVRAETSKTLREVLFDMLDPDVVQEVFEACIQTLDRAAGEMLKDPTAAVKFFADKYKVSPGQIYAFIRIKGPDDLTAYHVRRLRALATAIKDGDVNPHDIWENAVDIPVADEKKTGGKRGGKKLQDTQKTDSAPQPEPEPAAPAAQEASADNTGTAENVAPVPDQATPAANQADPPAVEKPAAAAPAAEVAAPPTAEETEQFKTLFQ